MKPAFFVIGAMKCGTTSLHNYLKQHPEICMSSTKETNYFLNENFHHRAEWYKNQFNDASKICGESSTNYSKRHLFPDIAERLSKNVPDARFIYLVRDPIERIVSHYVHNYSKGREKGSISDAIRAPGNKYILTSEYYYQIEVYRKWFDDDRILVVPSEDLKESREVAMKKIFGFLGADETFYNDAFEKEYHLSSKKTALQENKKEVNDNETGISNEESSYGFTDSGRPDKPALSHEDCTYLYAQMQTDVNKLRHWSGINFGKWKLWNRTEESLLGDE